METLFAELPESTMRRLRKRNLLDRHGTAWFVLATIVLVAVGVSYASWIDGERVSRERFALLAEQANGALSQRMNDYVQILRAGTAMYAASDEVGREQFRVFVAELELERYLPGIQGIGYARMVSAHEVDAVTAAIREEGYADFEIDPPPAGRDPLSVIVFLEPFDHRNRRAFGFDMYSDPVRREAMDRARDTGRPALSGKVTLVQEYGDDVQPGFLIYAPVYRRGEPSDTLEERRAHIEGFVYSPFRAVDLMEAVFDPRETDVELEIFDGAPSPENLLFDSGAWERPSRYLHDLSLDIVGRRWVTRFQSSHAFEASRTRDQPYTILFGGIALGLVAFIVLNMNARHRRSMREAAAALTQSRNVFRALVENIPGTVFRARITGGPRRLEHVSVGVEGLTGEPRERYVSGELSYDDAIFPEDEERLREAIADAIVSRAPYQVEYRVEAAPGEVRWVSERGRALYDITGQPRWLDGVILDVDDRKRAELAVREMAFHDPLTGLPNRRLVLDRIEHQIAALARTGKLGAVLFLDMDRFKSINDTLGHAVGDQLLIEVARRLRANLREVDTVARLGGDEFLVLLDEIGENEAEARGLAAEIAEKLSRALNEPYVLGEHVCYSTPSIGVALFDGSESNPDRVLRHADEAMYEAKAMGRNLVRFYDATPRAG